MLAELQQLSTSIADFNIQPPELHQWVKPLGRGSLIVARLDRAAQVHAIELRDSSDGLVKIQRDNHNQFPALKLVCPILEIAADHPGRTAVRQKNASAAERAEGFRKLYDGARFAGTFAKNAKRLEQFRRFADELRPRFEPFLAEHTGVAKVFAWVAGVTDTERFLRGIVGETIAAVARSENCELAEQILIGQVKKSGGAESGELPVFFDAWSAPHESLERVAHPKLEAFFHRVLLSRGTGGGNGNEVCALSGTAQEIERGNLPNPPLPSIGNTILFSANEDIPCLKRYELIGSNAFPVGKTTAQKLNSVARWITEAERKGKTWSTVPRNDDAAKDLVIAYVDTNPELDAQIADIFGTSSEGRENVFETYAEKVVKALEAKEVKIEDAVLHTLVLRRISKGQVQVELSQEYEVRAILDAFHNWKAAAANAPRLDVLLPAGKGKPAKPVKFWTPFPGELVQATKWIWIRGGSQRQPAIGCSIATVYDLFLGSGGILRSAAETVLRTILERARPLLLLTGDQFARHGRAVFDVPADARQEAVLAVTILGMTLYKLGYRMEVYMNETAFLLGRMLGLSDILHAQYCRVVRGGDLPPQLLGNQHYAMAAERPARALAVLGRRLWVYQGWAESARVDRQATPELQSAVKAAKWAVNQMGDVSPQVHGRLPEQGFDDSGKAEMLLGYLSRGGKENKEEPKNE